MTSSSSSHSLPTAPKILTPKETFTGEKLRGALTSVVSGGTSGLLNVLLVSVGVGSTLSAFTSLYVFGNILSYSIDILFAKSNFHIPGGYGGQKPFNGPLPYSAFLTRVKWLFGSMISKHFYRYVITVIIDTLIGLSVLWSVIDVMNTNDFLSGFYYRDMLASIAVTVFTFFLYNNILRFDWAYSAKEDPLLNVIILMWAAIVILVFATGNNMRWSKRFMDPGSVPGSMQKQHNKEEEEEEEEE